MPAARLPPGAQTQAPEESERPGSRAARPLHVPPGPVSALGGGSHSLHPGLQCPAGAAKPPNSSGRLPVGCLGHVTATPKDRFFGDVDARVYGPYITWELEQRRGFVAMRDDETTPFNKALRASNPGNFTLCATVQGHRGCLEGEVTAN